MIKTVSEKTEAGLSILMIDLIRQLSNFRLFAGCGSIRQKICIQGKLYEISIRSIEE